MITLVQAGTQAGQGQVDVVGSVHGTFPAIADNMMNMTDVVDDCLPIGNSNQAYLETGLLGTQDYLYYVPWMQATYIMAANKDALEFLPQGADINALTWEQFGQWCKNLLDKTVVRNVAAQRSDGTFPSLPARFPMAFVHRWYDHQIQEPGGRRYAHVGPRYLWPTIRPQSISYEFMQEPLLSGEVWVAFDHVARLAQPSTNSRTNLWLSGPAGPAGRGYMPVIVGLGIPKDAPNPDAAES